MVVFVPDWYSIAGAALRAVLLGGVLVVESVGMPDWGGCSIFPPWVSSSRTGVGMVDAADAGAIADGITVISSSRNGMRDRQLGR